MMNKPIDGRKIDLSDQQLDQNNMADKINKRAIKISKDVTRRRRIPTARRSMKSTTTATREKVSKALSPFVLLSFYGERATE